MTGAAIDVDVHMSGWQPYGTTSKAFFAFGGRVSPHSPGWSGIYYIDWASFKLTEICLSAFKGWESKTYAPWPSLYF